MTQAAVAAQSTDMAERHRTQRRRKFRSAIEGYLYLLPTLLGLGIFVYYPIVESFRLSLNRVAPFGNAMRFVGLDNYRNLLPTQSTGRRFALRCCSCWVRCPTGIALAVLLAILLSYPVRSLKPLHRTLIFVPVVISSAIAGVLFRWLYHPVVGYINYWMVQLGLFDSMKDAPNWLCRQGVGAGRRDHRDDVAAIGLQRRSSRWPACRTSTRSTMTRPKSTGLG